MLNRTIKSFCKTVKMRLWLFVLLTLNVTIILGETGSRKDGPELLPKSTTVKAFARRQLDHHSKAASGKLSDRTFAQIVAPPQREVLTVQLRPGLVPGMEGAPGSLGTEVGTADGGAKIGIAEEGPITVIKGSGMAGNAAIIGNTGVSGVLGGAKGNEGDTGTLVVGKEGSITVVGGGAGNVGGKGLTVGKIGGVPPVKGATGKNGGMEEISIISGNVKGVGTGSAQGFGTGYGTLLEPRIGDGTAYGYGRGVGYYQNKLGETATETLTLTVTATRSVTERIILSGNEDGDTRRAKVDAAARTASRAAADAAANAASYDAALAAAQAAKVAAAKAQVASMQRKSMPQNRFMPAARKQSDGSDYDYSIEKKAIKKKAKSSDSRSLKDSKKPTTEESLGMKNPSFGVCEQLSSCLLNCLAN